MHWIQKSAQPLNFSVLHNVYVVRLLLLWMRKSAQSLDINALHNVYVVEELIIRLEAEIGAVIGY